MAEVHGRYKFTNEHKQRGFVFKTQIILGFCNSAKVAGHHPRCKQR